MKYSYSRVSTVQTKLLAILELQAPIAGHTITGRTHAFTAAECDQMPAEPENAKSYPSPKIIGGGD